MLMAGDKPVERYLAFLTDVDRSPNTVKAYCPGDNGQTGRAGARDLGVNEHTMGN